MCIVESYGPHEQQKLKLFNVSDTSRDTIVFIHGGGWRDPSNSFDDFEPIIKQLVDSNLNIASINYRLSPHVETQEEIDLHPTLRHPMHLIDVLLAMKYLTEKGYNIILLAGHSVGASLCLQLLSFPEIIANGLRYVDNTDFGVDITTLEEKLSIIKLHSIFYIDGIYDVVELLKEYGDAYRSFVRCAFNSDDHFRSAFQLSDPTIRSPYKFNSSQVKSYIVHSTSDELLSLRQPKLFEQYLQRNSLQFEVIYEDWGKHEEVYTGKELGEFIKQHI